MTAINNNNAITLEELQKILKKNGGKPVLVWTVCLDENGNMLFDTGKWMLFDGFSFGSLACYDTIYNYGKKFIVNSVDCHGLERTEKIEKPGQETENNDPLTREELLAAVDYKNSQKPIVVWSVFFDESGNPDPSISEWMLFDGEDFVTLDGDYFDFDDYKYETEFIAYNCPPE